MRGAGGLPGGAAWIFNNEEIFYVDVSSNLPYIESMSNPALLPLLRAAEMARRLSAFALWFAALLGWSLPGAERRREEAEVWRYIEETLREVARLLQAVAAGKIPTQSPRAQSRRRARPDSVRAPSAPRVNHVPAARLKAPRPPFPGPPRWRDRAMSPPSAGEAQFFKNHRSPPRKRAP